MQGYISEALDSHPGPIRILSVCSGDGRDVIETLSEREATGADDSDRVAATLLELHPQIAQQARDSATARGLGHVDVRTVDAGNTHAFVGAVPAELVLLVGIFGNISDEDIKRTIDTAPQFCRPQATLLWSRGRDQSDRNDTIRAWFAEVGFTELHYAERDVGSRPALGAMRYDGAPVALVPGRQLFTFLR